MLLFYHKVQGFTRKQERIAGQKKMEKKTPLYGIQSVKRGFVA